jgi:hypothetical protein
VNKPDLLRAALSRLPELARDPARLAMWVDKGTIRAPMTRQRGFAWDYELNAVLTDCTTDPAAIFFIVADWLRIQQPEVLAPGKEGAFTFEADILDDKSFDIHIVLQLSETVRAIPRSDGGVDLETIAEPDPLFPDDEPLRLNEGAITSIWSMGTQIAPDPA